MGGEGFRKFVCYFLYSVSVVSVSILCFCLAICCFFFLLFFVFVFYVVIFVLFCCFTILFVFHTENKKN